MICFKLVAKVLIYLVEVAKVLVNALLGELLFGLDVGQFIAVLLFPFFGTQVLLCVVT